MCLPFVPSYIFYQSLFVACLLQARSEDFLVLVYLSPQFSFSGGWDGDFCFYVFVPLGTYPFTITCVYILLVIVTYRLVLLLRMTIRELSMLAHSVWSLRLCNF